MKVGVPFATRKGHRDIRQEFLLLKHKIINLAIFWIAF